MKSLLFSWKIYIIPIIFSLLTVISCERDSKENNYPKVTSLDILCNDEPIRDTLRLTIGNTASLKCSFYPSNAEIVESKVSVQNDSLARITTSDNLVSITGLSYGVTAISYYTKYKLRDAGDNEPEIGTMGITLPVKISYGNKAITSAYIVKCCENIDTLEMTIGDTTQLGISFQPSDANVSFTKIISADTTIVSIEDGCIAKAKKLGKTKISAILRYLDADHKEHEVDVPSISVDVNYGYKDIEKIIIRQGKKKLDSLRVHQGDTVSSIFIEYEPADAVVKSIAVNFEDTSRLDNFEDIGIIGKRQGKTEVVAEIVYIDKYGNSQMALKRIPAIVVSPNIKFQDKAVEKLCVTNWDLDFDKKLSFEEAAMITNVNGVFWWKENIRSFNELKYFVNLEVIPYIAFWYCGNLLDYTLPDNVRYIGAEAFELCGVKRYNEFPSYYNKDTLYLPSKLEYVGERALQMCYTDRTAGPRTVVFGENIKTICEEAICLQSVSNIIFKGKTPPSGWEITENSASNSPHKIKIYVPSESLEKYNKKFWWIEKNEYNNERPTAKDYDTYICNYQIGENDWYCSSNPDNDEMYEITDKNQKHKVSFLRRQVLETIDSFDEEGKIAIREYHVMKSYVTWMLGSNPYYEFIGY